MMALVSKPKASQEAPQPPTDSAPRQLPTDSALVLAARAGEEWAREALFRRYARLALGLAYRILPSDADIDETMSATMGWIATDSFRTPTDRTAACRTPTSGSFNVARSVSTACSASRFRAPDAAWKRTA